MRGIDRLRAATTVLQRRRLADPMGGIWEASDVQWWWRAPRSTDDLDLPVWLDEDGVPVGVALLTAFVDFVQADALVVPGTVPLAEVWAALLDVAPRALDVLVRDDDAELLALVDAAGFVATDERSATTWLAPHRRPGVVEPAQGYVLVDRTQRDGLHPMAARNHPDIEQRLQQTSLYDASLDLCVETIDGEPAGYALFWHDTTTGVGQLEPMRVFDEHQRRGLARALLTEGLDRLARRGAARLKVGFDGPAGEALYLGAGFEVGATDRIHRRR